MIKRDKYLNQLINSQNNGFPKVITGIRRCGKSFLLKEIFREYLLSKNVPENRIIILELDDDQNARYRDPLELGTYIRAKCADRDTYYVFIDEIQKVYSIVNPNLTGGVHVLAGAKDSEIISFVDVSTFISPLFEYNFNVLNSSIIFFGISLFLNSSFFAFSLKF